MSRSSLSKATAAEVEPARPEGPCKIVDGVYIALEGEELADFLEREANPPVPPPPLAVTPLQMRKALRHAGLKAQADAYLATLPEEAREEWEYCIEVQRDNAFLAGAAAALGMSAQQADDLFRLAKAL